MKPRSSNLIFFFLTKSNKGVQLTIVTLLPAKNHTTPLSADLTVVKNIKKETVPEKKIN
jgi:hypothetical protein